MVYINFKLNNKVETIEALETMKEAKILLKEYKMVDGNYYISKRCTKEHKKGERV